MNKKGPGCEKEFKMKYHIYASAASAPACFSVAVYACDVWNMQINEISLHVACGIYYHRSF